MKAKKSLGQNFLKNDTIINEIVSLFNVTENDLILEIGPGRGALTKKLIDLPSNLICIEIDKDMHMFLDQYESNKCHIIYEDILNIDLNKLLASYEFNNLYIVGNLPYYITSPIITKIIDSKINALEMAFMVQNEVADRFCSLPKHREYGYITLFINYHYNVSKEIFVSKENFNPIPKVDSAVIKLVKRNNNYTIDDEKYFQFLKDAFKFKRKTLKNNLQGYDFNRVLPILEENGLSVNARPEEISEEVFIKIFNSLNC